MADDYRYRNDRGPRAASPGGYRDDRDRNRDREPSRPQRRDYDFDHGKRERKEGSDQNLLRLLRSLDGKPYGAYKSTMGDWDYGDFTVHIDHLQADPYAPPSSLRVTATPELMGLPADTLDTADQRLATADFLVRSFRDAIRDHDKADPVRVANPGPEILQRSACTVAKDRVELRFQVQMPARGRTILGMEAGRIFDLDVPDVIMDAFDFASEEAADHLAALKAHVHAYEDHVALTAALAENGWVAFVADDSWLARRSGISQAPMTDQVPFAAPPSLAGTVTLPHAGAVTGMAIEPGVTVIVGGGYHGKSTLLGALQRGVYAHVPGDGRELVATLPDAMKVRAADGRAVTGVDVSAFINHLPGGQDTTAFSTENASGSTSQAASIVEAVELGCPLLLIDEDTSATNLMIRDARMRALVAQDKEPITPFVDRIGGLFRDRDVSTVLVMGGSGDYLDVADRVLMMDTYTCHDVTDRAREVVSDMPRERDDVDGFPAVAPRVPARYSGGGDRPRTKASGTDTVTIDKHHVDISDLEQVVDYGQTEAIAWMLRGLARDFFDGEVSLAAALSRMESMIDEGKGLDSVQRFGAKPRPAMLARPRRVDLGAAVNRFRGLTVG